MKSLVIFLTRMFAFEGIGGFIYNADKIYGFKNRSLLWPLSAQESVFTPALNTSGSVPEIQFTSRQIPLCVKSLPP